MSRQSGDDPLPRRACVCLASGFEEPLPGRIPPHVAIVHLDLLLPVRVLLGRVLTRRLVVHRRTCASFPRHFEGGEVYNGFDDGDGDRGGTNSDVVTKAGIMRSCTGKNAPFGGPQISLVEKSGRLTFFGL